jgi:acetolactate synthase-1/3 small subunit
MSARNELHAIMMLVEDKPGVMSRVAETFRRRSINIDTITVGKSEREGLSRIIITLRQNAETVDLVVRLLKKMIDVVEIKELDLSTSILRELVLIKVKAKDRDERSEVLQLVNIFRGQVVDVAEDSMVVQITGAPSKTNAFIELLKRFEILEITRTGIVALERGASFYADEGNNSD